VPISANPNDLVWVSIVPRSGKEGEFAIAWNVKDGRSGVDLIGSREMAEGEMSRIKRSRLRAKFGSGSV
jgi:hypothetical protein